MLFVLPLLVLVEEVVAAVGVVVAVGLLRPCLSEDSLVPASCCCCCCCSRDNNRGLFHGASASRNLLLLLPAFDNNDDDDDDVAVGPLRLLVTGTLGR